MRLLLDTHILIWAFVAPERLGDGVRRHLAAAGNDVFVSTASAWEMSIKVGLGKLVFPRDRLEAGLRDIGFEPLPVTMSHGIAAGRLPRHHNDPFDRMLVAQAMLEGLTFVTQDDVMLHYDIPLLRNITPDA